MNVKAILFAGVAALSLSACVEETTTYSSANKHVRVVNETSSTIRYFQGSNSGSSSWEEGYPWQRRSRPRGFG